MEKLHNATNLVEDVNTGVFFPMMQEKFGIKVFLHFLCLFVLLKAREPRLVVNQKLTIANCLTYASVEIF